MNYPWLADRFAEIEGEEATDRVERLEFKVLPKFDPDFMQRVGKKILLWNAEVVRNPKLKADEIVLFFRKVEQEPKLRKKKVRCPKAGV